jgi:hypothetical protein
VKKLTMSLAMGLSLTLAGYAAELKGTISDEKCGKAHADASEKSMKCVAGCIKGGKAAVLVTEDGKIRKIHNQDAIKGHEGHKVTITGNVDGDSVHVDSVKM